MRVLIAVALVACGRVSFDAKPRGDAARDDAAAPADIVPDVAVEPGCSDGTRDGFAGSLQIAGCSAFWTGNLDLRASPTGAACGNSLGDCASPSDACEAGWHICGIAGAGSEIATRITSDDCATGAAGTYVAAMSHCTDSCAYPEPLPCHATAVGCTEPVCCGDGCSTNNLCKDSVYPETTLIFHTASMMPSCGAMPGDVATGVLCCL